MVDETDARRGAGATGEAGESPDLVAACRALYAAIDRMDHLSAAVAGVSRSDLRALNHLEGGPVAAGALGRALGLTSGAVTALIDRLERRGLARRVPDPADRRGVLVEPTPALFRQLGPLYRGVAEALARAEAGYGEAERRAAVRHVDDARRAYEAAAGRLAAGEGA